ncbi:MAG: hypothetical protein P1S60_02945 [Anaerolineae bacterium]|nr:hypothetical protein [Anaerolineae bacterium]
MRFHLGLGREYTTWLFYHLYDFFAFLGIPVSLLLGIGMVYSLRSGWRETQAAVPLGFGLGMLLLDLSGTARGVVARVWLFLTPFAVMGAAYGLVKLSRKTWQGLLMMGLLASQLLVFNTFLRVVTTGITDPPAYSSGAPSGAHVNAVSALFKDELFLIGYRLNPQDPIPGSPLHVTLIWRGAKQMTTPYTVFVHLVDENGYMVTAHDTMPQNDLAPTTCWTSGDIVTDTHSLTLPENLKPGRYTLLTGLYILDTGERLPIEGPTTTPHNTVILTTVNLE